MLMLLLSFLMGFEPILYKIKIMGLILILILSAEIASHFVNHFQNCKP
jgi:hypothetical protein